MNPSMKFTEGQVSGIKYHLFFLQTFPINGCLYLCYDDINKAIPNG